jgi:hypothetical protein
MIQRYNIHHLINYMQFSNTDWCKSEDVEKFEQQNKQMLDVLKVWYKFSKSLGTEHDGTIINIEDWLCLATNCSITESIIISITGKKPEEL